MSSIAEPVGATTADEPDESPTRAEDRETHFWFPVTVELIGAPDDELADRIVARVFDELNHELDSRS